VKKEEAQKRLAEYQELIAKAQANQDLSDDELQATLLELEKQAKGIKRELKEIEERMGELAG